MTNLARVYWIHLASQADVLTQGYVGFTVMKVSERWQRHRYDGLRRNIDNVFYRALRKYGADAMIIDTIFEGTADDALMMEHSLRPKRNIGWNIGPGGKAPGLGLKHSAATKHAVSVAQKGRVRTPEERKRTSESQIGRVPTEIARVNMSVAAKRRVTEKGFSDTHRKNISTAKKGVSTGNAPWEHNCADSGIWRSASEVFDRVSFGQSVRSIERDLGVRQGRLLSMMQHIKAGWIPRDDPKYLEWLNDD